MKGQAVISYPAIIGRVIANLRKSKSINQAEAAEKAQLNHSTWSRLENGDSVPDALQLASISEALGTTPSEIMAKADKAKTDLQAQGFRVEMASTKKLSSTQSKGGTLLALVGAATLGALVAHLANDDKDNKTE